jgi:putative sporulation protein YtaF
MHTFILLIALSADVFLASMACGTQQIQIKRSTALCISMVCSGVLFLSLLAGKMLEGILRREYAGWLGFAVFFAIGAEKLAEYFVKLYIRKYHFLFKQIKIKFSELNIILRIYNDPASADCDKSSTMSLLEGALFALAMSLDGFFAGIGAGEPGCGIAAAILLNAALSFAALRLGHWTGEKTVSAAGRDFSWVAGVMFMILAIGKIPWGI